MDVAAFVALCAATTFSAVGLGWVLWPLFEPVVPPPEWERVAPPSELVTVLYPPFDWQRDDVGAPDA